LKKNKKVKQ